MTEKYLVSVIIPTKNSESTIGKCLESVVNQTYRNIEIIVVDGFSRDGTQKIVECNGAQIVQTHAERSEARNIGAKKSRGTFLFFVDSDMELGFSVIAECVKKVQEGNDAVIIPEVSVGEGFWAKCKALEKECYIRDDMVEAARFFRKAVFSKIDGYDSELESGEDWDLNQKVKNAGFKIGRIDAFVKHHEGRLSFRYTLMKKHNYGRTFQRYARRHPEKAKQQLKLIRPAFVKNWKQLANDPVHALGMFLMKACEYLFFEVGRLGEGTESGSITTNRSVDPRMVGE